MPPVIDLVAQATTLLPRAKRWCDTDIPARKELLATGVPSSTVHSLYPFNFDAYLMRAADLLRDPNRFQALSGFFNNASDAAVTDTTATVHASLRQTLAVSAYASIEATLPSKSPSPTTRRSPRLLSFASGH